MNLLTIQGIPTMADFQSLTFEELLPRFLRSRQEMNLRWCSLTNYDCFSKAMLRERPSQHVDDFTEEQLREMITLHSRSTAMDMAVMLRWAFKYKLIATDVTRTVFDAVRREEWSPPDYWTPVESHSFYNGTTTEYKAAFALALFAGIRPFEVVRIRWEQIDTIGRRIRIEPAVAKTRRMRLIDGKKPAEGGVPTILWAQLALHRQPSGFVFPRREGSTEQQAVSLWNQVRREIAERAMVRLPRNVFRHTFATYMVALTGNPAFAARVLGHCDLYMLARHYDGVATARDAEDFFRPRPVLGLPAPREEDSLHPGNNPAS